MPGWDSGTATGLGSWTLLEDMGERCGEGVKLDQKHFYLCSQETELDAEARGPCRVVQAEWQGLYMKNIPEG